MIARYHHTRIKDLYDEGFSRSELAIMWQTSENEIGRILEDSI